MSDSKIQCISLRGRSLLTISMPGYRIIWKTGTQRTFLSFTYFSNIWVLSFCFKKPIKGKKKKRRKLMRILMGVFPYPETLSNGWEYMLSLLYLKNEYSPTYRGRRVNSKTQLFTELPQPIFIHKKSKIKCQTIVLIIPRISPASDFS